VDIAVNIAFPIIFSIIAWFLLFVMVPLEREDIAAGRIRDRDHLISLGIIFVAVHLLWHTLARPSWRDAVAIYLRYKGSFLIGISFWIVVVFYFLGIYTATKWIGSYCKTKRRLYYTAIGILIFALLMAVILVVPLGD